MPTPRLICSTAREEFGMAEPSVARPVSDQHTVENWTPELGLRLWVDLVDACEQLLLLGLRREIGPDGDLEPAYRQWQTVQRQEHDRAMDQFVENMNRALENYGESPDPCIVVSCRESKESSD
jgi:hypothetical protein